MNTQHSIIAELEEALQSGTPSKRQQTLRRITDLFLLDNDKFNEEQVEVFDDVLHHLIEQVESRALIELSERLAPVRNAPSGVIRTLSRHDEIAIAGPVLSASDRLSTQDLIDIAETKGQSHLLAITQRNSLHETVTDTLITRGSEQVVHQLVQNPGAHFSAGGYTQLTARAESDEKLSERIARRADVPAHIFQQLLMRATDMVRVRLMEHESIERQAQIQQILAAIRGETEDGTKQKYDFTAAQSAVKALHDRGELNQTTIVGFSEEKKYPETIAAIAMLCSTPIEIVDKTARDSRGDAFLIPCKAAGLSWLTLRAVLHLTNKLGAESDFDRMKSDYLRLSQATAQRVLRFWCMDQAARKEHKIIN